jgi:hypothetical protein
MSKRVKELEVAKEMIKSAKASLNLDQIDQYLIEDFPLAEHNLIELDLTNSQTVDAQRTYSKIAEITSLFKNNCFEYIQFFIEHLQTISELFVEGKNEEMQDAIKRLEQMVLLNPTNIEAAKLLSQSLEKALFAATTNRFQEQIKINAAKLNNLNRNAHSIGLKDTQSNAPDGGYAEAKQEATANQTKYNPEDIQQLLSQNENLRTTVTQLRQKLAQFKQAQDRTAGHSSLYGTPKNKVPKDDASHPNSRGKGKSDFATDAGGDGGGNNGTSSNNFQNEFQEEATYINNLPDILQAIILSRLKLHISQLIAGNGYYQTISSNVELLAVIVEEVINQVSTSIFHIFEIHLKTKPELAAIQEAKEKNMINEEFLDSNRDSLALIFEQVDQIFRFTHGKFSLLFL